jgi:uncharacterized protein (TIGR02594 family)
MGFGGRALAGVLYGGLALILCRLGIHPGLGAAWVRVAEREGFVQEWPGPRHHPRILEYHATTTLEADSDEVAWCSSFVNWCLERVRVPGTGSALAKSWLDWGDELCVPQPDSIVVLQGESSGAGHVGFLIEARDGEVLLLGGNQEDRVGIRAYPAGRVLSYRWPSRSAALRF